MNSWNNPLDSALKIAGDLTREVTHLGDRLLDRNLRLAITGLRRSGKTVFTTSLIHHLLGGYDLSFMNAANDRRLMGARVKPGDGMPFPFGKFEEALKQSQPHWPEPTEKLTELRLELRYKTTGWIGSMIAPDQGFDIDIIDYPGEWLLDLPLLQQDFASFSQEALRLNEAGLRATAAKAWREKLDGGTMSDVLKAYRDFLQHCQYTLQLAFIQPGRLIHGFDEIQDSHAFCPLPAGHPLQADMEARYRRYVAELVQPFYTDHFSSFDRQVVLVDLLSSLNAGPDHFADTQRALNAILESFAYGQNSWLSHLFSPRISKVLFAASKADHVAANQHANLKQLLQLMVDPALRRARFEGIEHEVLALAALRSTDTVRTEHNGQILSCVRGRLKNEARETVLFPGEIPPDLPERADWESGIFRFYEFAPRALKNGVVGQHIRLDQAIEFLIGDKLK